MPSMHQFVTNPASPAHEMNKSTLNSHADTVSMSSCSIIRLWIASCVESKDYFTEIECIHSNDIPSVYNYSCLPVPSSPAWTVHVVP